ncbi:Ell-associated factor Eaf [Eumeta japonica]|uniref:Ell-associated factor Eaf n=1 Tax=Eumeta variegata TaxID=151549 RepID=A0A4C1W0U8_EUMVA|nr:Ell-associated factor Eaf [Eumeta japonica]
MGDKLGLNYNDVRELKLGASFSNNKASQYHTIKYDFKPASVDVNKMATVDVGTNNQVTVTVPHLDGAGVPQTVFKGSQRPYTKECVLIIDRVTGEITLEKLSSNIQVKKTRQETTQKPRPLTPVTTDFTNTTQRSSSRTRVATSRRTAVNKGAVSSGSTPAVSGNQGRYNASVKTPPNMVRSPPRVKNSSPQAAPWSGGNSTLASLPMIGLDEPSPMHNGYARASAPSAPAHPPVPAPPPAPAQAPTPLIHQSQHQYQQLPMLSTAPTQNDGDADGADSSSSSSSDSGSDSDSASDSDDEPAPPRVHQQTNGNLQAGLPNDVLKDDLCLSESGSDSD